MASTPTVLWWQAKKIITLKVQVPNANNIDVKFEPQSLRFSCTSKPLSSPDATEQQYQVELNLFKEILTEKCTWKKVSTHVELTLEKKDQSSNKEELKWARLLKGTEKNHRVKVDWDSYADSDEEEENESAAARRRFGDLSSPSSQLPEPPVDFDELFKNTGKKTDDPAAEFKWIYLLTYNILSVILWIVIFARLIYQGLHSYYGNVGLSETYAQSGYVVIFAQVVGVLELVNALLKLVKARIVPAFLLHAGRDILLFGVVLNYPPVQEDWGLFGLFVAWSLGDIIRYSFYFMETISLQGLLSEVEKIFLFRILRWLRYTAPLLLLPLGFAMELRLFYRAFIMTTLPPWAYSAIPGYCVLAYLIGAPYLFYSMYQQRRIKLRSSQPKKKK